MQVKSVLWLAIFIAACAATQTYAENKFIFCVEDNRYFPHYSYAQPLEELIQQK